MPTLASYDGANIFGLAVESKPSPVPYADQENAYFGSNGIESLYGGTRGYTVTIESLAFGANSSALAAGLNLILSYRDGIARPLTDTLGITYPQARLMDMEPTGKVMVDSSTGNVFQKIRTTFRTNT